MDISKIEPVWLSLLRSCTVIQFLAVHFLATWERVFDVLAEERIAAGVVADYHAEQEQDTPLNTEVNFIYSGALIAALVRIRGTSY